MPNLKQPKKLQDLGSLRVVKMMRATCESWMKSLREAAEAGSEAYLKETQKMTADCHAVHQLLTWLPRDILEPLTPVIIRRIIYMITTYDGSCSVLKGAPWYKEVYHNRVCSKMLSAVLLTCTRIYFTKDIKSSFAQKLIIRTLDCVPNLTILAFNMKTENDNSALLASNIHHLRNLKSFEYRYHCTDEVVEQLALHCSELRTVILSYSRAVTDASVQHLMKLNKLDYVDLMFTSITSKLYGALLSELPKIRNIVMMQYKHLFAHIPNEQLYAITYYVGYIRNVNILTQKCPNISTVVLFGTNQNLTKMTALNKLVQLRIAKANYEICNLNAVLIGIDHRLSQVCLFNFQNVNLVDIVNLCSCLENLVLEACTFVHLNENADLNIDLPYYKSVTDLKLVLKSRHQIDFRYLRRYVNLQMFECKGVDILTDDFVRDAMRQGAFRNIQRFCVEETGDGALSMRTVGLLLEHCEHLREIGYLKTWRLFSPSQLLELGQIITIKNYDVIIK